MIHTRYIPRPSLWLPLCLLLAVVLAATWALAADRLTVDLGGTPESQAIGPATKAAITRLLADENAQRTTQTPPQPALTAEQFLMQHLVNILQAKTEEAKVRHRQDACARFGALTVAQQATVIARAEWGGSNPCP